MTIVTSQEAYRHRIAARNNVRIVGRGQQPMPIVRGFGCYQHRWQFVTTGFENVYRIVLFDFVGSGASDKTACNPEHYSSLHGYAKDLLEICEAFRRKDLIFAGPRSAQ